MSKRKLTDRQKQRTAEIQKKRIERANSTATNESAIPDAALGAVQPGLIVSHFGVQLLVESNDHQLTVCNTRQNLGNLVVGDRVHWQALLHSEDQGVIVSVDERKNLLERPLYHGNIKPVAANIDQIVIIASPIPEFSPELIDRYLIGVEIAGIETMIVFNKIDLVDDETHHKVTIWQTIYSNIGYRTLKMSAKNRTHTDELAESLAGKTSILVGQSGVGKSSTIKSLIPDIDIQTDTLVKTHQLGKHKTSASRLYHLPNGGHIIDSPGVRDFGVWNIALEKIAWGFREFRPFIGRCKFTDCEHRNEPECAIKNAVSESKIDKLRLTNFHSIIARVKEQQRQSKY